MLTLIALKRTPANQIADISVIRVWSDWTVITAYSSRILCDSTKSGIQIRDAMHQINAILKKGDTLVFFCESDKALFTKLAKRDIDLKIVKRSKIVSEHRKSNCKSLEMYIAYQAEMGISMHDYLKMLF